MAWWHTQFIFRGDKLISEGLDPVPLDDVEIVLQEDEPSNGTESYTRVIVSGYALYGELRGYYALGIAHWHLDRTAGRAFISEASQHDVEPVSSLSPTQRSIIRECLIRFSPEAWETSNSSFRSQLEV